VESKSKRKFDDPKYQFELIKNIILNLHVSSGELINNSKVSKVSTNNFFSEYLGEFVSIPATLENFIKNDLDHKILELVTKEFII